MKQLFIALVLINLGYPLLQRLVGVDSAGAVAEVAGDSYSEAESPRTSTPSDTPTFIEAPGYRSSEAMSTQAAAAGEATAAQEVVTMDGQDVANGTAAQIVSAGASADVAVPVSEAIGTATSAASQSPVALGAEQCVIAGPFRNKGEADALVNKLADSGIQATLQPRDTSLLPDYMVYVGPQSSEAEARALVAAFAARNVDSHLIGRGDLKNALSLGVFSRGPLADSMRDRLRDEGYEANIAAMSRNRRGYQVRASLPPGARSRLVAEDTPLIDCPIDNGASVTIASAKSVL